MIELFFLVKISRKNADSAMRHGRSGTVARIITVVFWFIFEFWGMFIAAAVLPDGYKWFILYYLGGLLFAAFWGFLSRAIYR